ncbi:kinase-like protein [Violaceomyces palustris]|uniref:Kinase-like protein n=1 Tax=Violaceomyces palustris TaxID=1673888 RepID=A0ACD0NUY6_9BASI|nr:kinase-like protein [Violaceomyces palustris]
MPQEYIDILGGLDSTHFANFRNLMRQGFRDVRKHAERIIMIVELMQKDSKLPCFTLGDLTSANLRDRFQLALSQSQCDEFVDKLILNSAGSAFTRLYDTFQYYSQGVL